MPLKLADGTLFHPDFTFLHPQTRKEVYWEHFGMMGDSKYADAATLKIMTYAKNGINQKDQLIVSFETARVPIDYNWVNKLIKSYLLD